MSGVAFERAVLGAVRATTRTRWVFATLVDRDRTEADVELTHGPHTERVVSLFGQALARLKGVAIADERQVPEALEVSDAEIAADPPLATVVSALRAAVCLVQAAREGRPLAAALGGAPSEAVPLYANINRSLLVDRSPEAFGLAARRAVEAGFAVVKCAPFDEVDPSMEASALLAAARRGIERVAAVREAIGTQTTLLVDCHSRLTEETAPAVARELEAYGVAWFEEPLQPLREAEALARIARQVSTPLAGGESGYGEATFRRLLEEGALTVVMPDVKHCGGPAEALRVAQVCRAMGRGFSMHSPSGPLSQLLSAHVTAAAGAPMPLEHVVGEVDWRAYLLDPPEIIEGGRLRLPQGPGLGACIAWDQMRRRGEVWSP